MLKKFGYKYDTSVIPEGMYCYSSVDEDPMESIIDNGYYSTKPCPYYLCLGKGKNACKFKAIITEDFCFDDQCKICKENLGI